MEIMVSKGSFICLNNDFTYAMGSDNPYAFMSQPNHYSPHPIFLEKCSVTQEIRPSQSENFQRC